MTPDELLHHVDHRPWPLPGRPWAGFMRWCDLAFLHWHVDPERLKPLIPDGLELDLYEGQAWVGVVPFRMVDSRVRFTPAMPGLATFPELNVRTYVRAGKRAGVWFFSLDAGSALAVRGARALFNLPYFDAAMSVETARDVAYRSRRTHRGAPTACFSGRYAPGGPVFRAAPGTLEHFLTERYCLFNRDRSGQLGYLDVHHLPWPLQPATCAIETNSMAEASCIALPNVAPVALFAKSLDVIAWSRVALVSNELDR